MPALVPAGHGDPGSPDSAGPVFVVVERRSASPLMDFALLRYPPYALANLAAFLGSMTRMAVVLLTALFLRAVHGDTAFVAGLKVMPLALGTIAPHRHRLAC